MIARMSFEDHFSKWAREYVRYRPRYPSELFEYLASVAPNHRLAWDCGTGNGQAAIELVCHFAKVVATDASLNQLEHAFPHDRIEYRVERAEDASLATGSVDLITVAVAVHWFDLRRFYEVVKRVLTSGGIISVWTYYLPQIEPKIDQIVARYYFEVLAGYWSENVRYVDEKYETLPFPFEELQPPRFEMESNWELGQMLGFLDSWSAVRHYKAKHNYHPVQLIWTELADAWGASERQRIIHWPLYLRVGRTKVLVP